MAGGPVRWPEAARGPGPRPDPQTASAVAGRAAGGPGCPDPDRNAAADRASLAAAWFHRVAGDPRRQRSRGHRRSGDPDRRRPGRPGPARRTAASAGTGLPSPGGAGDRSVEPGVVAAWRTARAGTCIALAYAVALGAVTHALPTQSTTGIHAMTIKAINVRNQFKGTIKEIVTGDVLSEIDVQTASGIVTSVITTRSVKELELQIGSEVIAFVKSTEVSIAKL